MLFHGLLPSVCIIAGYLIWRFILGDPDGFKEPDPAGGFWPEASQDPKMHLHGIYEGGIIVPLLIGMLLMVIVFSIERFLTIRKALGNGSISDFIRKVQYHLANRNVDAALSECDKQRGSVANVMKAGLRRYKEMITEGRYGYGTKSNCHTKRSGRSNGTGITHAAKKPGISFYYHFGGYPGSLVGYGIGMIRSFAALGEEGGGSDTQLPWRLVSLKPCIIRHWVSVLQLFR